MATRVVVVVQADYFLKYFQVDTLPQKQWDLREYNSRLGKYGRQLNYNEKNPP